MTRMPAAHLHRAAQILRGGDDGVPMERATGGLIGEARHRLADYLDNRCEATADGTVNLPSPRTILVHARVDARAALPYADGTTEQALQALIAALLSVPRALPVAAPRHDAYLEMLRGHPDLAGAELRRACLATILGRAAAPRSGRRRADVGSDERAAALAALLRLGGVLRPAALDLLPAQPLRRRGGLVVLAHPSSLLAGCGSPAHEVPLDAVTQVAWTICHLAGVRPRDDERWLQRQGHSLATLRAVARVRWRLLGLDDWLALHLTGEQPCVPPDDDAITLDQGWLPLLLRGEVDAAALPAVPARRPRRASSVPVTAAGPRARVHLEPPWMAHAQRVSAVARAPLRSGRAYRWAVTLTARAARRSLAAHAGCAADAPPRHVVAALAGSQADDGTIALYTLLCYVERRAETPVATPRRPRTGATPGQRPPTRATTVARREEQRRLRARSLAAYWRDGLAILRAMAGVPLRDWTATTLTRAFPPEIAYDTHRRRARVLAAWAATAAPLLPWPVSWSAPPSLPEPRSHRLLSPGQIAHLLVYLRDHRSRVGDRRSGELEDAETRRQRIAAARRQRADELVVLASLCVCYRCRVDEAATRLWTDLAPDLSGLYIVAADAKGRTTTSRGRGWLPDWAAALLLDYRAQAQAASTTTVQPLLPSARDGAALGALVSALEYHLARHGLSPHDLRHAGITADVALTVALRCGDAAPALPTWARLHRSGRDAVLVAAIRAGHAVTWTTATTYTHCALWALARIMATWHDPLGVETLSLHQAARLYGHTRRWLANRLAQVRAAPLGNQTTITLADLALISRDAE